MTLIHPTAVIHPSARLAAGVEVGPYCVIGPDVSIGHGTVLHNHVTVQALTTIGMHNVLYPFCVIGADPQDRKHRGERTMCIIGNRNSIREQATIHRGTINGGAETRIGDDNLIMVGAHIAHDCVLGDEVCLANQVMLAGHVIVEDGANIGGGAGIHHFATVGAYSFVGGLARITKDVPPYMLVEGSPAVVRAVNDIAMVRRQFASQEIEAVRDAFKRLYRDNGAPMADKLVDLRRQYPESHAIVHLCDSLTATALGVHGRARESTRRDDKRHVPNQD